MAQKQAKSKKKKKKKKTKIQFRNYIPKSAALKKYCVEPAKPVEFKDEFAALMKNATVLNHDLHDITPKKCNWDLKRDCAPQLDQLRYLTQLKIRSILGTYCVVSLRLSAFCFFRF